MKGLAALRAIPSEKLRYLLVGGYNTAVGCISFALLYWLFSDRAHYLALLVLSHALNAVNAYVGYRIVVFRATGAVLTSASRFALVYGLGFLANLALLPPMVVLFGGRVLLAQAVVIAIIVAATYVAHRYFSFRQPHRQPGITQPSTAESTTRKLRSR